MMAVPAFAETASTGVSSDTAGSSPQVEEIIVTATRRSQSLQDVPVSVGVISGDALKSANLKGVRDLQFLSPSVYVTTANGASIAVRGVGTTSTNNGGEQAVGLVVDGVVIGFVDDLGLDALPDLDHVEVLRGPQGMLFGKNASAGVISITTKKPSFSGVSGEVHASYGELNDTNDSATINVPLSSTVAARLTGYFVHRDGFVKNVLLNKKEGDNSSGGVRGKLLWAPSDKLEVMLNGDFRSTLQGYNFLATWENFGLGYKTYAPGGLGQQALGIVAGPDNIESANFMGGKRLTRSGGISAEANYKTDGGYTLTSVSAYRKIGRHIDAAIVGGALPFSEQKLTYHGDQYSQEFRVTSPADKPLTFVAGVYAYKRSADYTSFVAGPFAGEAVAVYGPGAQISLVGGKQFVHNEVQSAAAFGEATYHLTSKLNLVAGGRYTYDKTRASTHTDRVAGVFPAPGGIIRPAGSGSAHDTNFSYRVGPQYHVTPNVMVYATASSGYKGPVIDAESTNIVRLVKPETVKSYEAGVKSELFDRRLVLDIAVFNEKFTNFQTSVWEPSINAFRLGNAGGLRSKGVEVTFTGKPTADLTISGGLNYLDAKYTDFAATCYSTAAPIPQLPTTNPSGVGGCYRAPGASSGFVQAAGFPLANASKWAGNIGVHYEHPVMNDFVVDMSANYVYRSKFYNVGYDPNTVIPGYGIVGLNIGISPASKAWRVGVFARNLFDKYFQASVASTSNDAGAYTNLISPEARRTVGVSLDASF
jgi:iron complex outermembrane receptor protein